MGDEGEGGFVVVVVGERGWWGRGGGGEYKPVVVMGTCGMVN